MDLDALIEEAEALKEQAAMDNWGVGKVLKGEELETWTSKAVIYLHRYGENDFLYEKVKENARDLTQNGYDKFLAILGVLKAQKASESQYTL
ncbi:hypothetical protein [Thalassobacillus hwangdonensis]|uniref:Uncharacterized protein n=1 Tax=Thalassobacillus hwangdonensis TaxID=546108 RepID=A0ABW3L0N5_9BACI